MKRLKHCQPSTRIKLLPIFITTLFFFLIINISNIFAQNGLWGYAEGKGIHNRSSTSYSMPGSNVGSINRVLVECTCKQIESTGDPDCPPYVRINGVPVYRSAFNYDPNPTSPSTLYPHYSYRMWFYGAISNTITYSTPSGEGAMRGMAVFVFRNSATSTNQSTIDSFSNGRGFFRGPWQNTTIPVEPCNYTRTATITVPLHEHGNNGGVADYAAQAQGGNTGPVVYAARNGNNNLGGELRRDYFYVTVPPGSDYIRLWARSDDNRSNPASFLLVSAMATIAPCCVLTTNSNFSQDVTCFGECDGVASVSVAGGTPPYTYNWSNNATTSSVSGLCPGNYSVTVNDANGCEVVDVVTIGQGPLLEITGVYTEPSTCNGNCEGTATAQVFGGRQPYTFQWSNGQTTQTATGLCEGTYVVVVTDSNGCEVYEAIPVVDPIKLQVDSIVTVHPLNYTDGEITIESNCPYGCEYSIDDAITWQSDKNFTGLPPDDYVIWVRNEDDSCEEKFAIIRLKQHDLKLKVFLEGAHDLLAGLMHDQLRQKDVLPRVDPFFQKDTVYLDVFENTGPDAIVDWVLVEIRDTSDLSVLVSMPALLQRDGDLVGMNGYSFPVLIGVESSDYYVVIRHRNHLPAMTRHPVHLDDFNGLNYDFTTYDSHTNNGSGQKKLVLGVWAMFAGNCNQSSNAELRDINFSDKISWSSCVGQNGGYFPEDIDLDADVSGMDRVIMGKNSGVRTNIPFD